MLHERLSHFSFDLISSPLQDAQHHQKWFTMDKNGSQWTLFNHEE